MMIYLLVFISAYFCFFGSEIVNKRTRQCVSLCLGIIILVVFAGIRDSSVGIDVSTYIKPTFQHIIDSESYSDYQALIASDFRTRDLEPLFVFVSFIAGSLFHSINGLLLVYELIIIICIVGALLFLSRSVEAPLKKHLLSTGMLCYCLLFYNMSLTMIRQSIACALIFLAISSLISGGIIGPALFILTAVGFHGTAFFSGILVILYFFQKRGQKIINALLIVTFLVSALGRWAYFPILSFINLVIPVPPRYLAFEYMTFTDPDVNIAWLYLVIVQVVLFITMKRLRDQLNIVERYFGNVILLQLALFPLSIVLADAGRILYYPFIVSVAFLPICSTNIIDYLINKKSLSLATGKIASIGLAVGVALVYWIGTVGLNDYTGTVVYQISSQLLIGK